MKYLMIFLLLLISGFDGGKLVKTRITQNITILLPKEFHAMTDDEIAQKYLTAKRPTAMYTNRESTVDFGLNQTATRWRLIDLPMLKDIYKGSISGIHSKVTFIQDTIVNINKRDFIVLEFASEVADEDPTGQRKGSSALRQYSYLQYTIEGGKILVFNFTCPLQLQNKWQETAKAIMNSVKIKS